METRQRYFVGILTFDDKVVAGSLENGELIDNNAYAFDKLSYGIYHAYVDLIGEKVVSFGFANANLTRTNKMVKQDKQIHISTATFGVFNESYLVKKLEDEKTRQSLSETILSTNLDDATFSGAKIPVKLIDNELFIIGINHPSGEFDCLIERNRKDEIVAVEIVLDGEVEDKSVEFGYKPKNTTVLSRETPTKVEIETNDNVIQGPVVKEETPSENHDEQNPPLPSEDDEIWPVENNVEYIPTTSPTLSDYTTDDLIREILRRFL